MYLENFALQKSPFANYFYLIYADIIIVIYLY